MGYPLYQKILSAVDGSFHSELAARHAVALAAAGGSELVVLAVDTGEVERAALSGSVECVCQNAETMGLRARGIVREGETVATILSTIWAEHADLLVVATRHSEHRLFVRSITQKLMLNAPCSMIAVKPAGTAVTGKTMLLPVAHREYATGERILLAAGLAKFYHYRVELLHVVERKQWYNLPWEKLHKMRQHAEENMMPIAKGLTEEGIDVEVRAVVAESSTDAILKEAAMGKHSLALVGASRRGILKKVVSGNPIEELLSRLLCDVLIWRPRP